jgi:hypothetical protein
MDTPLPSANSPQVLTRMLEVVSRGVRTTRGLQEALGVPGPTVRAYVHAASWLSLVDCTDPVGLSPLGLEYVYAGQRRAQVYTRVVWSNPLAADLLSGSDGQLPELEAITFALQRLEPGLDGAQLARQASDIQGLLVPVAGKVRPSEEEERQLPLPLGQVSAGESLPALSHATSEHDPDAYRYVLACLLDHGELGMGHLRALLDRVGSTSLALGGLLDLAVSRGDAVRVQERLVVTSGAVERQELLGSTPSLLLSDPGYRAWLDEQSSGVRHVTPRRDGSAARYRQWDRRLLGRSVPPEELLQQVEQVMLAPPVAVFPLARPEPSVPLPETSAFLDTWERQGLLIALPPTLAQLLGGLEVANRILRQQRGGGVTLPDLGDRPVVVHSGILHPGEPQPRSVPDARTLRQRVLMHAPYPACVAALLLLHRLAPDRVGIGAEASGWVLQRPGLPGELPLLAFVDLFARHRGWVPVRRARGGLSGQVFVALLESLGIAAAVGRSLVLSEPLFSQLQTEMEEREVHARLSPLADAVDAFLSELE